MSPRFRGNLNLLCCGMVFGVLARPFLRPDKYSIEVDPWWWATGIAALLLSAINAIAAFNEKEKS